MTRTFVGIDPGKAGAIVSLRDQSIESIMPMPVIQGKRPEYNVEAITRFLWDRVRTIADGGLVVIEKLQPLPPAMGGSIANFNRGIAAAFEWVCVAYQLPHLLVPPQAWQKVMFEGTPKGDKGDTKQRSIMAARRLFPSAILERTAKCKGPDDGICDALLLAEYGRRIKEGQWGR